MVCWMLSVAGHRITCQFGLKWEPGNTVLITLAEQTKNNLHSVHFLLSFWLLETENVTQEIILKNDFGLLSWHHIGSLLV